MELAEKLRNVNDIDNKIDSIMKDSIKDSEDLNNLNYETYNYNINLVKTLIQEMENLEEFLNNFKKLKIEGFNILNNSETNYNGYNTIKALVNAHENLTITKNFMENFNSVEEEINKNDLLEYHKIVFDKEEFLYEMEWNKNNLNEEDSKKVEIKISNLKKIIYDFTSFILKICCDYVENCDSFEILNIIIKKEEDRDLITIKSKAGISSQDLVEKQYYIENVKYSIREPKFLLKKVKSVINSSIKSKIDSLKNDKDFFLKLENILNDLKKLKNHNLYFYTIDDFIKNYHINLKNLISYKIVEIEPENIIGIIDFKTVYYKMLLDEFGKEQSVVGERLIDDENEILKKYTASVTEKLKLWIENITISEVEKFRLRERSLNKDELGKLVSPGFINLMQIIKVQLDPVQKYPNILKFIIKILIEKCAMFKNAIINAIEHEYKLSYDSKGLSGFEDYCIMFGNSGFKIAKYFSSIDFCTNNEIRELQNIFINILKASNKALCDFVILTCKSVICKIFSAEWSEKKLIDVFIVTLDDFLFDYYKSMTDYSFNTFICDLCENIYLCYKNQLNSSNIVLNSNSSLIIKNDYEKIEKLFFKFTKETNFVHFLKPLLKFVPLLETKSGEIFILEVKSLLLLDKTIKKSFVENILERREDLQDSEKGFIKEKLNEIFKKVKNKKMTFLSFILKK